MPYASVDDLPDAFKNLPAGAKTIALETMNAILEEDGDEDQARQAAWRNIKLKYRKEGEEWVLRKGEGVSRIIKADPEQRTVWGVVYAADDEAVAEWTAAGMKADEVPEYVIDTQGDWVSEETLRKAFRDYMVRYSEVAMEHGEVPTGARHTKIAKGVVMLQSALLPKGVSWPETDSPPLQAALTWVRSDYIGPEAEALWQAVKKGQLTGYSLGGYGKR